MKTLRDKVIVITGASSGIGEAMAKEYAAQGAKVVLGARSVQKLQLLAGDIRSTGGRAAYCGVDVTKPAECKELIGTAVREFGGIDVLICNAGISMRAIFDDVELDVLHKLMDVNFWGTVYCCKYALPYLQASKGSVVGISSVAGLHGLPFGAHEVIVANVKPEKTLEHLEAIEAGLGEVHLGKVRIKVLRRAIEIERLTTRESDIFRREDVMARQRLLA